MKKDFLLEEELYNPIKNYLMDQGFIVRGEVGHCDIFAVKDDKIVIVELKRGLTIELLIQAAQRQKISETVFVAVPKPKIRAYSKKWTNICHLLRKLELGFIVVSKNKGNYRVEVVFEPTLFDRKKSVNAAKKKRNALLEEFKGRSYDANIGGSRGKKLVTAYKEKAIEIARYIREEGVSSAKDLKKAGFDGKQVYSIMYNNFYGWFDKVDRGTYSINENCINYLDNLKL